MDLQLNDDLKEILSEILRSGSIFFKQPLQSLQTDKMKEQGFLVEECLPAGFRYRITEDFRDYLTKNPRELYVDYSWAENLSSGVDYGII